MQQRLCLTLLSSAIQSSLLSFPFSPTSSCFSRFLQDKSHPPFSLDSFCNPFFLTDPYRSRTPIRDACIPPFQTFARLFCLHFLFALSPLLAPFMSSRALEYPLFISASTYFFWHCLEIFRLQSFCASFKGRNMPSYIDYFSRLSGFRSHCRGQCSLSHTSK